MCGDKFNHRKCPKILKFNKIRKKRCSELQMAHMEGMCSVCECVFRGKQWDGLKSWKHEFGEQFRKSIYLLFKLCWIV